MPKNLELKDISKIEKLKDYFKDINNFNGIDSTLTEYIDLISLKELSSTQKKRLNAVTKEMVMAYGLKNGVWASNLAHNKYYSSLAQIRADVVRESNCQTSLELILADRIVANYWRAMRVDALVNRLTEEENGSSPYNQLKINYLRELYKSIEFSDRQLNTNIILLREIKQPQLNIKLTTENAFIAQNQQINVDKKINESK